MSRGHVEIRTNGTRGTVLLDGTDISSGLAGLTLDFVAGELPTLTLDPLVITSKVAIDSRLVSYKVLPAAHDALVALGWTPPGGES